MLSVWGQVENRFAPLGDVNTVEETRLFTEWGDDVLYFDWVSCYVPGNSPTQLFSLTAYVFVFHLLLDLCLILFFDSEV